MKIVAWVSVLILLLTLSGLIYLYHNTDVIISAVSLTVRSAQERAELFDNCKRLLSDGAFPGTVFSEESLTHPEDYAFHTYTLTLQNNCFIDAEMVEIQLTPAQGDILQLNDYEPLTLQKRSIKNAGASILTASGNHAVRELTVTYYIWGIPFRVSMLYG